MNTSSKVMEFFVLKSYLDKNSKRRTTPWRRIGGVEVQLHAFLTSALDEGEGAVLARSSSP
jgi:hypothetical protein